MRILLVSLIIFCLRFPFLLAQDAQLGTPSISSFSRTDYQAGTQNWMIGQDSRGIMYFANNKGLLEFDGTKWQIYPLPKGTIVRSLAFAPDGKIYIGGQDELGYLQINEQGEMNYTSLDSLIPKELQSFEDIWRIFLRPEGIYFCSEKAVFLLEESTMQIIRPPNGRFENFFEYNDNIYIQDQSKGLYVLKDKQVNSVKDGQLLANQRIIAILPYDQEQALVISRTNGLFIMNDTGIRPWTVQSSDFLKSSQAYCAILLSDGNYAIGTPLNGLLLMDKQGKAIQKTNKEQGLQNNTILSIYQDAQQNLWLGLDNGIDYVEINSPFSTIGSNAGLEGTGYASIIYQDKLYLGTNQGLFYTDFDVTNTSMQFQQVKNATGQVWSINPLDEQIIIGQHQGASYLNNDQIIPFSSIQGAWKFMPLRSKPGYALEGTYSGLILYKKEQNGIDPTKPTWKMVTQLEDFNESARVFEEDEEGNIWVSHAYKGLYKIKLSEDLTSIEKIDFYNSKNGLPTDLLINVTQIRNELVFTTPKGIYQYQKENNQFVEHDDLNKIFGGHRNVHRLIEDELGNIWFAIDEEFGMLKVQEQGVYNKLQLAYFNQIQEKLVDGFEHIYAHNDNNIFIGTEQGFIHYNPSHQRESSFPFKTLIRQVTSITHGDSTIYRGQGQTQGSFPSFHYQLNDFRFTYSAPYYEKINFLQYRYKLEGFEDTWSTWSSKTEKEYTNLPAGDYQFIVKARNAYGEESAEQAFAFSISPPWYLSSFAKAIYILGAISMLIGFYQYGSRREKMKVAAYKVEQEQQLKQKESEFKKEVEKSEGEVIKLRNEKLESDINHKNSQLASATMHLVQKSEILIKIKNDLNRIQKEAASDIKKKIEQISRTIDADIRLDDNWEQFESYFDQVHENFFKRLRHEYPHLTPKDQKLCAYLRMNLTTKEIAPLLNISVRGVEISRYRLRKKLNLDSEINLVAFILKI